MFKTAVVRIPAPTFSDGLTTATIGRPDFLTALKQHNNYIEVLSDLGLEVIILDPAPEYPDAHFVEDAAVVFPELAVVTRPGAPSRRGEAELIGPELARHRNLHTISAPGNLDGGDVLVIGRQVFVGLTERTNQSGFDQFRVILEKHGYDCSAVPLTEGLHLKSSVNHLGGNRIIITEELVDEKEWSGFDRIVVPVGEEYAANILWINGHLLTPEGFPGTLAALANSGLPVITLPMTEMQKMDGGLTCLSLRF